MENFIDVDKIQSPISIFWTGGWDSTYRVVELSRQKVSIQPVYIMDENRRSNSRELASIETVTKMLQSRSETLAEFLPVKIVKVSEIPENEKVSKSVRTLMEKYGWGMQHEWTARVSLVYPGIEMCIEKVPKGYMPTRKMIGDLGKLTMSAHGWVLDKENSDEILVDALGNITLPIFETTEVDMLENIKKWGYEDVMANIWFCHNPIQGKPCGLCSPCHTKYDSNMLFLLPESAQRRCKKFASVEKHFGKFGCKVYRKVARFFIGK